MLHPRPLSFDCLHCEAAKIQNLQLYSMQNWVNTIMTMGNLTAKNGYQILTTKYVLKSNPSTCLIISCCIFLQVRLYFLKTTLRLLICLFVCLFFLFLSLAWLETILICIFCQSVVMCIWQKNDMILKSIVRSTSELKPQRKAYVMMWFLTPFCTQSYMFFYEQVNSISWKTISFFLSKSTLWLSVNR